MFRKFVTIAGMTAVAASTMLADFSYQETTKITGGSLVAALKMAGVFSKQARQAGEPIQTTVALKGDRMVHRSPQHATIIDLGSETITTVDLQKKTYTVMTFAEMKQMMEQMSERMRQAQQQQQQKNGDQVDMKFKVSAKPTDATKQINGFDAREMLIKMEMQGTDQKSGQTGSMVIVADTWIAPAVPGYREVREFQRRMAEKINWTPGGNMFMSRPDVIEGMAQVYKESAKLDGMPVLQTMTMGAEGTVPADGSSAQPAAQQPQPAQDKPSVGSAIGGALGGRFGLGRKKPQQDSQAPPAGNSQASGTLLETTMEMSSFSSNPVDASQFEVPAGFKKVESEMRRGVQ
jgi:hypothetical protein